MSTAASAAPRALNNGLKAAVKAGISASKLSPGQSTHVAKPHPAQKDGAFTSKKPLLSFNFEPHPSAINTTTHLPTKLHAEDPSHPFHIKIRRRLAAFDPNKLHWRVHAPTDICKKAAVRRWAAHRVRRVVKMALGAKGFQEDGRAVEGGEGLKGALLIALPKDRERAFTADIKEVESSVNWILSKVVEWQNGSGRAVTKPKPWAREKRTSR